GPPAGDRRPLDRGRPVFGHGEPATNRSTGTLCYPDNVLFARLRRRRRPDQLRAEGRGYGAPGWHLCRTGPEGRKARRIADRAADQIRIGYQPEDRACARPQRTASAARPRRPGHRVRRRVFIAILGVAPAVWVPAVTGQQPERL